MDPSTLERLDFLIEAINKLNETMERSYSTDRIDSMGERLGRQIDSIGRQTGYLEKKMDSIERQTDHMRERLGIQTDYLGEKMDSIDELIDSIGRQIDSRRTNLVGQLADCNRRLGRLMIDDCYSPPSPMPPLKARDLVHYAPPGRRFSEPRDMWERVPIYDED